MDVVLVVVAILLQVRCNFITSGILNDLHAGSLRRKRRRAARERDAFKEASDAAWQAPQESADAVPVVQEDGSM